MTPLSMKLAEHVADCLKLISSGTDDVVEEAGGKKKKKESHKSYLQERNQCIAFRGSSVGNTTSMQIAKCPLSDIQSD